MEQPSQDRSSVNVALLILRLFVALIFMVHGAQLVFGMFGGPGLAGFAQKMGPIGYPVALGEFFGGLGILVGFLSRFSSAALVLVMLGAIALVHGKNGFMAQNMGYEFNLALIGMLLTILVAGPGIYTIGRMLPLPKVRSTDRPIPILE